MYSVSPYFTINFAGLPDALELCGACVRLACADAEACAGGAGELVVAVIDDAAAGEVGVSSFLARSLAGRPLQEGEEFGVTYEVVDCAPYGSIMDTLPTLPGLGGTETVAEPIAEPVAEPVLEPVAEPVAELAPEQVPEPVPEPVAEPIAEPVAEPIAEPIAEPVAEPVKEPVAEPVAEPMPIPAPEPTVDPDLQTSQPPPALEERATAIVPTPSPPPTSQSSPQARPPVKSWSWPWSKHKGIIMENKPRLIKGRALQTTDPVTILKGDLNNRMQQMACGLSEAMYLDRQTFAAVNGFSFESIHGYNPCGTCATVSTPSGNSIEVMFVDDCSTCGPDEMLISEEGLGALNATSPVEESTYSPHPCRDLSDEGIFFSVIDVQRYYARFGLGNLPEAVSSTKINGVEAEQNHIGQWEVYADLTRKSTTYEIELTTASGRTIAAQIPFIDSQYLGVE